MPQQINHSRATPGVATFEGTYREVMDLLEEARAFAASPRAAVHRLSGVNDDTRHLGFDGTSLLRLEASCEALRVTSRLTHCLAWVLVHKAIHAGELSPEAAYRPENRLTGGRVCIAAGGEANPRLPRRLRSLLADSRALYIRLARLDARMSASAAHA